MSPISFLMTLFFAFAIPSPFATGCPSDERNYLLDFKGALLDRGGRLSSWQGYNCCQWKGIACDYHSAHVIRLHLIVTSLTGEIHPSLFNLQHLQHLDLSGNCLEGVIPPSIANISRLESLDLSYNRLEGVIPPCIANFTRLKKLNLKENNLTGVIPLFGFPSASFPISEIRLSSLRHLDLSGNQLNATIPNAISKLFRLEMLSLNNNNLTGHVSLSLFDNLTKLWALGLSGNHISVNISSTWIPRFVGLEYLGLSSCKIEGDFPAFLSTQYKLVDLDLSNNNIVGNIPTWLWNLPQLRALNLSNNKLEGPVAQIRSNTLSAVDLRANGLQGSLPVISFCLWSPNECILDLSENEFNGSISAITGMFVHLSVSGNNLTGGIPDSICMGSGTEIRILDLSKNRLTNTIPSNMGKCSNMVVLNLAQNDLQGEIPEELGNLTGLFTLNLNGNRLQGMIPSSIANCTYLQVFDIGNNGIEGSIPVWIGELTELRILSLTSNHFQGTVPSQLTRLQYLQIIDLSHNNLSGTIPTDLTKLQAMVSDSQSIEIQLADNGYIWYGNIPFSYGFTHKEIYVDEVTLWIKGQALLYPKIIKALKSMDLSHNNLSGHIPGEMGSLKGLIALNLAKNNLSGIIPESLGGMLQLESLDLSGNKLTGNIPVQFEDFHYLEYLNLSDNMLSGRVPWGKQMTTFDASSFVGNPDLHGLPLENRTLSSGDGERGSQEEVDNTEEDGEEEDEWEKWWAVGIGLSYGLGFSFVVGILSFAIQWRNKYFALLDRLVIFVFEG